MGCNNSKEGGQSTRPSRPTHSQSGRPTTSAPVPSSQSRKHTKSSKKKLSTDELKASVSNPKLEHTTSDAINDYGGSPKPTREDEASMPNRQAFGEQDDAIELMQTSSDRPPREGHPFSFQGYADPHMQVPEGSEEPDEETAPSVAITSATGSLKSIRGTGIVGTPHQGQPADILATQDRAKRELPKRYHRSNTVRTLSSSQQQSAAPSAPISTTTAASGPSHRREATRYRDVAPQHQNSSRPPAAATATSSSRPQTSGSAFRDHYAPGNSYTPSEASTDSRATGRGGPFGLGTSQSYQGSRNR